MKPAVGVVLFAPRALLVVAAELVPGETLPETGAAVLVVVVAPFLLPLLAPGPGGGVGHAALGVVAAGPGIRPLDASALAVPLLAPLLRPAIGVTVLGRGAVLETSGLLAVSVHDAIGAVILRPSLGPALPLRRVRPLGRLAVDERELVGVVVVQLLPGLLPRLTVGVATGLDRPELPVRERVGRFPKLFLPLHGTIRARAANHRPRHHLAVLEVLLALLPPPPRAGAQDSLLGAVLGAELAHRARQRILQTRLDAAPRQTRRSWRGNVDVVPLLRGEDRRVGDG